MTEERFTCNGKGVCWFIIDNERRRMVSSASDIVRLLNNLDKEIKSLQEIVRVEMMENIKMRAFMEEKGIFEEYSQMINDDWRLERS